ncbi:MAG: hypothetical protein QW379_08060 [Thermoplasmata archaeon]
MHGKKLLLLWVVTAILTAPLLAIAPSSEGSEPRMRTSLSRAHASFRGESSYDYSGVSVAIAGDVNGDGYDDILISAPNNDDGGTNAGQTYLIFGKASGWAMDISLSSAVASFWGENSFDYSGRSVAGAGDVNGDGYDDILIGAPSNDEGGGNAGQTYLIFGRASGWSMDMKLSSANASFWGEASDDNSGFSVAGAGDVNGDGYDDILIGAPDDEDGGSYAGQTYLIFGKASGWAMDTKLSSASASFWGENSYDYSGYSVAGAGDVNGDGYDDILIGAYGNDDRGSTAGQTYLILGKASGWAMDTKLSSASASFCGEDSDDDSGLSIGGGGDVNADGYDDILIGAYGDEDGGSYAGQTYLILPNVRPPGPKNLRASNAQNQARVTLSWDAADSWAAPLECYRIYRSVDGSNYVYLTFRAPTDRTYVDTNVSLGRTYYYRVETDFDEGTELRGEALVSIVCDRDTDLDGIGDTADWDDDGDGVPDGQDAFPLDPTEWLDTDRDGKGNSADTDDDNDGIPDASDPEPLNPQNALQYHLSYLNTTLQGVQTTVAGISSTVSTMNTNLNALSSTVSSMQTSLTNLIKDIDADIAALGAQLRGDISGLNTTLRADIAAVRSSLSAVNSSLQSSLEGIRALVGGVSSDLSAMDAEIRAMNRSLSADIAGMEARLALDVEALGVALEAVNASLRAELSALEAELEDFRADLLAELGAMMAAMEGANRTQTESYRRLEGLVRDLNSSTLAGIQAAVSELDAGMAEVGGNLSARIEGFRSAVMLRLENVSRLMATVDDIKSLSSEVKVVQGGLSGVKREQEETSRGVAGLAMPAWGSLLLIIIVLVVAVLALLVARGRKGRANSAAPGAGYAQPPLPPPETP